MPLDLEALFFYVLLVNFPETIVNRMLGLEGYCFLTLHLAWVVNWGRESAPFPSHLSL